MLPLAFTTALAGLAAMLRVRENPRLLWAFLGAAALLFLWNAILLVRTWLTKRPLAIDIVLRKQHYVQACAQGSVFLYWGWYWPQVYDSWHLILAQLLFAYAFDMLLVLVSARQLHARLRAVSRHLQHQSLPLVQAGLVLPAVRHGGAGLARKRADSLEPGTGGARTSSILPRSRSPCFHLACCSPERAGSPGARISPRRSSIPPHMYLMLFLVALPGQFFFGITLMTHLGSDLHLSVRPRLLRGDRHLLLL